MPERAEIEAATLADAIFDELLSPGALIGGFDKATLRRAVAAALDRVRDARGDDEPEQKWQLWLNAAERDVVLAMRRSPQGEDHEALMRKVDERRSDPEFMARVDRIMREEADVLAALASPSRDGTVAVEDVAEWLRVRAGRTHGNGASSALYAAARDLRAEFGPARAGESNEGGNQNDERRH